MLTIPTGPLNYLTDAELFSGASAVLWCASSFGRQSSDDQVAALVEKALLLFDPTAVLDAGGVRTAAYTFSECTALLKARVRVK